MANVTDILVRVGADLSRYRAGLQGGKVANSNFQKSISGVQNMIMSAFSAYAIYAFVKNSVAAFSEFDLAMHKVNTIARMTSESLGSTASQVKAVAIELGKSPSELAEALYNINSAGFKGAEAMTLLRASTEAAVAGFTTVDIAANAAAQVINAYGKSVYEVNDILDIMFKTVEMGINPFEEIAQFQGASVATATKAGIAYEYLSAAIATMTKQGIKTDEAFTAMNRFMMALVDPTQALTEAWLAQTGVLPLATLQTKGFTEVLSILNQITGGAAEEIVALGFEMRSFKAAATLTGTGANLLAENIDAIAKASGRAGASLNALEEVQQSYAQQVKETMSAWKVGLIEVGGYLAAIPMGLRDTADAVATWKHGVNATTDALIEANGEFNRIKLSIDRINKIINEMKKGIDLNVDSLNKYYNVADDISTAQEDINTGILLNRELIDDSVTYETDLKKIALERRNIYSELYDTSKKLNVSENLLKDAKESSISLLRDTSDLEEEITSLKRQMTASQEQLNWLSEKENEYKEVYALKLEDIRKTQESLGTLIRDQLVREIVERGNLLGKAIEEKTNQEQVVDLMDKRKGLLDKLKGLTVEQLQNQELLAEYEKLFKKIDQEILALKKEIAKEDEKEIERRNTALQELSNAIDSLNDKTARANFAQLDMYKRTKYAIDEINKGKYDGLTTTLDTLDNESKINTIKAIQAALASDLLFIDQSTVAGRLKHVRAREALVALETLLEGLLKSQSSELKDQKESVEKIADISKSFSLSIDVPKLTKSMTNNIIKIIEAVKGIKGNIQLGIDVPNISKSQAQNLSMIIATVGAFALLGKPIDFKLDINLPKLSKSKLEDILNFLTQYSQLAIKDKNLSISVDLPNIPAKLIDKYIEMFKSFQGGQIVFPNVPANGIPLDITELSKLIDKIAPSLETIATWDGIIIA